MKKIYLLLALFLSLALGSCKNDPNPDVNDPESYCFRLQAHITYKGTPSETEFYIWSSAKDMYDIVDLYEYNFKEDSVLVHWDITKSDAKSLADCQAKN